MLNPLPLTAAPVTERFDPPVFDIFNVCVLLAFAAMLPKLIEVGDTEICAGVVVTVTLAEADFVASAALVAFTEYVPAVPGAVNSPELDTEPPLADHVTPVLLEPVTVAVNCCVAPAWIDAEVGLIETLIGVGGALTFTVTDADFVRSATLVAMTEYAPAVLGAV